jgi:MoxR-like ATPase
MKFYSGDGIQRKNAGNEIPTPERSRMILLGQPLLLTGEAGTGKTQFAYNLAWELGLDEPLKFETKSTSVSRDLFYTYDIFRRFHDMQQNKADHSDTVDALSYIQYQALGKAILYSTENENIRKYVPKDFLDVSKKRSVVLIDEVDKASRDFPNDILNEIDLMYFRIPELGNIRINANPKMSPIVIITSNSEKDLPDPFLRRCAYYHINFPKKEELKKIVLGRFGENVHGMSDFLDQALGLFYTIRDTPNLRKKPSIAEVLSWIFILQKESTDRLNPMSDMFFVEQTLRSSLLKTEDDQKKAGDILERWKKNPKNRA